MTKRVSLILIISLLALAFVAMSAYAVKSPDETRRVINPLVYKSLQYAFPDGNNIGHRSPSPHPVSNDGAPLGNATDSRVDDFKGVQIGDTYYDYQHNGRMTRMVDWGNDVAGGEGFMVHFEWMRIGPDIIFPLTGRHYAYNVYYAGGASAGTFLDQTAVQSSSDYAGYVTMDVTEDGRAVLGGHNNQGAGYQAHTYWDLGPGFAFFGKNRRVPDSTLAAATGQVVTDSLKSAIWPSMCYQEHPTNSNLNVTHVFTQVSEPDAGDPQAIIYFRKIGYDDLGDWDYPPYVVDTVFDIAQDVACSKFDGKVALIWIANLPDHGDCDTCSSQYGRPHQQWDNDVYYQISSDYGATWNPRVNVTQNQDGVDGYRPYTDLQALLTQYNDLHIVWGSRYWPANANSGGEAGLLRGRIFHWGENLSFGNIRTVVSLDWDQEFCNGGAWQLNGAKMNISECDGKLYVLWTQFNDIPNGIEDDCAERAFEGRPTGAANGELYLAVSDDMGLTWDGARNLTNTRTPHCDSATGVNGECRSEHWASMNRLGTNLTGDMSGSVVLDPSGSFGGDYFLDVQYMADVDPGGIIQGEGTWQQAGVRWFRLACVEPVPTPGFAPSWIEIAYPEYTKHGTAWAKPLIIENPGNIATTFDMALNEDASAHPGWLTADASITTSVTIPSGANNTVSGNVTINGNVAIDLPGTIVHLSGNMTATGNHVNSPYVFPIDFWIADTLVPPTFDTITTGCFSLLVSNTGNFGNQGEGQVNLDFFDFGDCDNAEPNSPADVIPGDATVYAYDGSPVICWSDATDTVRCNWSIFGQGYMDDNGFIPEAHETGGAYYVYDTCDGGSGSIFVCNTYYSRFATRDTGIQIENWWYTPDGSANQGSNFIVQVTKISIHQLATGDEVFTGLNIGEAIDWDIPSDSAVHNRSGFNLANKLIYQQGSEFDEDDQECQENSDRYGGIELLAIRENVGGVVTEDNGDPYGAYTGSNSRWVYPSGGFVPSELDSLMTVREGYVVSDAVDADLHSVMTFKSGYDLTPTRSLWIYKCLITSRMGHAAFLGAAQECHNFYNTYLRDQYASCGIPCGDVNCDSVVDSLDVVECVDYLFKGDPTPPCQGMADVDGHRMITIRDAGLIANHAYLTPEQPLSCPSSGSPYDGPVADSIFMHTYQASFPSAQYFASGDSTYTVQVHLTTDRTLDAFSLPFRIRVGDDTPQIGEITPRYGKFQEGYTTYAIDSSEGIVCISGFASDPDHYFFPGTYAVASIEITVTPEDSVWRPIFLTWDSLPPIQYGRYTHYPYVTEPSGNAWTPAFYRLPCIQPIRGDMDLSGDIDISDLVLLVDYMFTGGFPPRSFEEADLIVNSDMQLDVSELVFLVDYMFTSGPPPPPCPPEF